VLDKVTLCSNGHLWFIGGNVAAYIDCVLVDVCVCRAVRE